MNKRQPVTTTISFIAILIVLACNLGGQVETTQATVPEDESTSTSTSTPESISTLTPESTSTPVPPFGLTSAAFNEGETIPGKYKYILGGQCNGENISPPLSWVGAPAGTQSFTLILHDPDGGNWVHWAVFNIPGGQNNLPEAVSGPDIGLKGVNSFGKTGYGGPCPPSGTHRYIFTLFALDSMLSLTEGASKSQIESAMQGHILQQVQLMGLAGR